MATSSEVTVRVAGIDPGEALSAEPAQRKWMLNAPRGLCNVIPHAVSGGVGPGVQRDVRVQKKLWGRNSIN